MKTKNASTIVSTTLATSKIGRTVDPSSFKTSATTILENYDLLKPERPNTDYQNMMFSETPVYAKT